jgi:hypothetical protein
MAFADSFDVVRLSGHTAHVCMGLAQMWASLLPCQLLVNNMHSAHAFRFNVQPTCADIWAGVPLPLAIPSGQLVPHHGQ